MQAVKMGRTSSTHSLPRSRFQLIVLGGRTITVFEAMAIDTSLCWPHTLSCISSTNETQCVIKKGKKKPNTCEVKRGNVGVIGRDRKKNGDRYDHKSLYVYMKFPRIKSTLTTMQQRTKEESSRHRLGLYLSRPKYTMCRRRMKVNSKVKGKLLTLVDQQSGKAGLVLP